MIKKINIAPLHLNLISSRSQKPFVLPRVSGYDCYFGSKHTISKKGMTPMSKTSIPSVTSRDSKGLKFLEVVSAAYNKAALTEDEAQRVNEARGLSDLIANHIAKHRHPIPPLLRRVGSVKIPAVDELVLTEQILQEANIGYAWPDFKRYFLGKKCPASVATSIACHNLEKDSLDAPILQEFGDKAEITMGQFIWLIRQQSHGQAGNLIINGYANIAYIKDEKGVLWAVNARWYSDRRCWRVFAYSVEHPSWWFAGFQVLSSD